MAHLAIPTMAQAMANKVGTTAHARQPQTDSAAGGIFETLLTAVGNGETGKAPDVSRPSGADDPGMWGILLSKYMTTGLAGKAAARNASFAGSDPVLSGLDSGNGAAPSAEVPERISEARYPDGGGLQTRAGLGSLSAAFESGAAGADAIGYDPGGGTSYGVYQIASKPGTMDRFIDFLAGEEPAWAERLRAAGEANTGGRGGGMPRVWREIASEDPERFTGLQHAFIEDTHYRPAERKIAGSEGIRPGDRSEALREVLWSTAVQHGPDGAARIFGSAMERLRSGGDDPSDAAIIEQVYALRAETADRHAPELASALRNRFRSEKRQSLDLLANIGNGETAVL
ncbi:hypothetical protein [Desulfococcus sp.]|uniref:VgrG-related protein n=1 Tax=Desulfococcus sp. TaxID=2025834 RepID=UPI003593764E